MKRRRHKTEPVQYGTVVYVMLHIPFIWWCKIGITKKTAKKRADGIDRAVLGFPLPIFAVPLPWARDVEQWLHEMLSFLSCQFYKGDGCTEWFWLPAALFAIPVLLVLFVLTVAFIGGMVLIGGYLLLNC